MDRATPPKRDDYPARYEIPTRWLDNDIYGHVNNVNYYSYFDTAIAHFLMGEGGLDPWRDPIVGFCVESGCRFRRGIRFPDRVTAGLRGQQARPIQRALGDRHLPRRRERSGRRGLFRPRLRRPRRGTPGAGSGADPDRAYTPPGTRGIAALIGLRAPAPRR